MKRITIRDIATRLNVNPSTVSRALKNHPDIGLEMRNEVQRLAAELHYHPNSLAINLRKQQSRLIGLIIPEVTMFFFPSVIKGIEQVVRERGYNLLVLQSKEALSREIEKLDICYDNGVEGLLLSVSHDTNGIEHLAPIREAEIPLVVFDKVIDDPHLHQVVIDDRRAAATAAEHLLETGCRDIVGLFGNPNLNITQFRVAGFTEALARFEREGGRLVPREQRVWFAGSSDEARTVVANLCKNGTPDGFFTMSDELLAGTIPALKAAGKRIPEECSVLSISDGYLPTYLDPPVTFIRHSGYTVGRVAAERLCALIDGSEPNHPDTPQDDIHHRKIVVDTELVVQSSTRRLVVSA